MGRNVADATKACRIRRTRGEMGLFFLRVAALRDEPDFFFAAVDLCTGFLAPD
jgi:hypothetical protein